MEWRGGSGRGREPSGMWWLMDEGDNVDKFNTLKQSEDGSEMERERWVMGGWRWSDGSLSVFSYSKICLSSSILLPLLLLLLPSSSLHLPLSLYFPPSLFHLIPLRPNHL